MSTDLDIARGVTPRPITDVADDLGLPADTVHPWGPGVAKVSLDAVGRLGPPRARYVLVTATTPTPFGEGKTTIAIGLAQALTQRGHTAVATLRQPSLGPTFGVKGGAAGGGRSQVIPMERINLHLTGDFHAATAATNMLAAVVDAHLHHGAEPRLDPRAVAWRRVLDVDDRALRNVIIGLGGRADGVPREAGFDITAAGEAMAILTMTSGIADLRARLGRIVVGHTAAGEPVSAEEVGGAGAMAALMLEALQPNLVQTLEGTPALIHAGPFANVAPGVSSVIADLLAVRTADFVVTEAGFGADVGAEKFFNLKCRASGLSPDAAVVVTTVRGLKVQSGRHRVRPGRDLPASIFEESPADVVAGAQNLRRHVDIVRLHGVEPVVAINAFDDDHPSEIEALEAFCESIGVRHAVAQAHADGGAGCIDLADEVERSCKEETAFRHLYDLSDDLATKIATIATRIYGADGVDFEPEARRDLKRAERDGFGGLGICVAKTPLSLSHDPGLVGVPTGWRLPVRGVRVSAGAGFVVPLIGTMQTMPGLGSSPAAHRIDIDEQGRIVGLE
jgi:formate--tetrahydrofolate ligase